MPVKELNIREMRANIGRLAELVAVEGELLISRRGQPIARVLPMPISVGECRSYRRPQPI